MLTHCSCPVAQESSSSSSSRPRIEDKLGISDEDKDSDDNSKEEDTALDNTLIAGGSGGASAAQLLAARNVAETLNHLTQEVGNILLCRYWCVARVFNSFQVLRIPVIDHLTY